MYLGEQHGVAQDQARGQSTKVKSESLPVGCGTPRFLVLVHDGVLNQAGGVGQLHGEPAFKARSCRSPTASPHPTAIIPSWCLPPLATWAAVSSSSSSYSEWTFAAGDCRHCGDRPVKIWFLDPEHTASVTVAESQ